MKQRLLISIMFLSSLIYAQNGVNLELRYNTKNPIYNGYDYKLDLYLTNELSDVPINVPEPSRAKNVRHIIQYEYSIFDSNENILYGQTCRVGEGGRGSGNCPARSCSKNSPIKLHTFRINLKEVGTYQVRVKYLIVNEAPHNFTNINLSKTFNINVVEEPRIPLRLKAVSNEDLNSYSEISDFDKMRDSTEVIKVGVAVDQEQLNGLVKYKNLREVRVWGESIDSIPSALFDLDLRLLSISFSDIKKKIKLPKLNNLRSLAVKSNSEVLIEGLSDDITHLFLENCTVKFSGEHPRSLIHLNLKNVKGNLSSDFKRCTKSIQFQLVEYNHPLFVEPLEGMITEMLIFNSSEIPDIQKISLLNFSVQEYTGDIAVNLVTGIAPGARVRIPKSWKKLNKPLNKTANVTYY